MSKTGDTTTKMEHKKHKPCEHDRSCDRFKAPETDTQLLTRLGGKGFKILLAVIVGGAGTARFTVWPHESDIWKPAEHQQHTLAVEKEQIRIHKEIDEMRIEMKTGFATLQESQLETQRRIDFILDRHGNRGNSNSMNEPIVKGE